MPSGHSVRLPRTGACSPRFPSRTSASITTWANGSRSWSVERRAAPPPCPMLHDPRHRAGRPRPARVRSLLHALPLRDRELALLPARAPEAAQAHRADRSDREPRHLPVPRGLRLQRDPSGAAGLLLLEARAVGRRPRTVLRVGPVASTGRADPQSLRVCGLADARVQVPVGPADGDVVLRGGRIAAAPRPGVAVPLRAALRPLRALPGGRRSDAAHPGGPRLPAGADRGPAPGRRGGRAAVHGAAPVAIRPGPRARRGHVPGEEGSAGRAAGRRAVAETPLWPP